MNPLMYPSAIYCLIASGAMLYAWKQANTQNSKLQWVCFWAGLLFTTPLLGLWDHRPFSPGPALPVWAAAMFGLAGGVSLGLLRPLAPGRARWLGLLAFALSGPLLTVILTAIRQGVAQ